MVLGLRPRRIATGAPRLVVVGIRALLFVVPRQRLFLPRLLKEHHDRGGVVGDALTLELPPRVGFPR